MRDIIETPTAILVDARLDNFNCISTCVGQEIDVMHFLFSAKGRLSRKPFNLFMFSLYGGFLILGGYKDDPPWWSVLFLLSMVWPAVVIQIKRWHDRGKSGHWFFINFIPFIGSFWVLIETSFLRGTVGENRYGPDPLSKQ